LELLNEVGVHPGVVGHDEIEEKADIWSISLWREPSYVYAPKGTDLKKF
jgi:hypothetical protein